MREDEKKNILVQAIKNKSLCSFTVVTGNEMTGFPVAVNDGFVLIREENELSLDGYQMRPLSAIDFVETVKGKYALLCRLMELPEKLGDSEFPIDGYKSLLTKLKEGDLLVQVEDEREEIFSIGAVERAEEDKAYIREFDAEGKWEKKSTPFSYKKLTCVGFGGRYAAAWKKYFKTKK